MGFVVKKCPHCGSTTEHRSSHDYSDHYGSPIRPCYSCGKTYIDNEYSEPALSSFEKLFPSKLDLVFSKGKLANILVGGFFIVTGIIEWIEYEYPETFVVVALIIGIIVLIPVFRGLLRAQSGIGQEEFESCKEIYLDSLVRLLDHEYVNALSSIGKELPSYLTGEDSDANIRQLYMKIKDCTLCNGKIVYANESKPNVKPRTDSDDMRQSRPERSSIQAQSRTSAIPNKSQFCRYCGAHIPTDSAFCPKCGKSLVINAANEQHVVATELKDVENNRFYT